MLHELTKDQEDQIETYKERWLKVGLNTSPINVEEAAKAALKVREASGYTNEPIVIEAKTPLHALRILGVLKDGNVPDMDTLFERAKTAKPAVEFLYQVIGGQIEAYWLSLYTYCRDVLEVKYSPESDKSLDHWKTLADHAFWWWSFDNYIIFSGRPTEIKINGMESDIGEPTRVHSTTGPAILFEDLEVFLVDGIRVPGWIIQSPEKITLRTISEEDNVTIRQLMLRMVDRETLVEGAEVIDEDTDASGMPRTLYKLPAMSGEGEPLALIRVQCPSTGKSTLLRADPKLSSCAEVVARSFLANIRTYKPTVET